MDARRIKVTKEMIVFVVAVTGLVAMTFGAVVLDRQSDATLVAAFVGLLGYPIFMKSERR